MKKTICILLILISASLFAQDISTHIPKKATYIVTINPAAHIKNGDLKSITNLEVFTRTNEYGSGIDYLYGDEDLDPERKAAFSKLFSEIFSNPQITGVDTTRKIFIFNETLDSIHYWAYAVPISNSSEFGIYTSTHLFENKPEINKGSGFSSINQDKISIGWTATYAIILLADYDYWYRDENIFAQYATAMDSTAMANAYELEMEMRIADSTAMANMLKAENDSVIPDSIRIAQTNDLLKEQEEMLAKLAKDTTPEEYYVPEYPEYPNYEYAPDANQLKRDSTIAWLAQHQLKRLINLDYDESVESVPNFRAVNAEESVAVYWYNYGEMMQQFYEKNMRYRYNYYEYTGLGADTANIHNMWKDSYVVSLIHFEGNIAKMEQRSYFSPALQEHTTGLYSGRVDKKMFRYVKGENLMGFSAMSIDMEKFMKFYGSVYRETINNSYAGIYENYYMMMWDLLRVFIDDKTLYNLLDGQFLFAVTDLKPYTSSYVTYDYDDNFNKTEIRKEKTEVRPEFIMIAGIGEQKKAGEIISILERIGAIKKQNSKFYLINTPGEYDIKMFLSIQNGMLIVTNNEDLMVNHLKKGYGKNKAMSKKLRKVGRKSALVGWWDGKKSLELVKENYREPLSEEDKKSLDLLQQDVNNGLIIGRKAKNGVQRIDVQIELNEQQPGKKQTGFVRFFQLLNSLFLVQTNR